ERIAAAVSKRAAVSVAYPPAQEARLRSFAKAEQRWKSADAQVLEREEATSRINVANIRAALWHPHAARVHPAKLVAGLAEAVERLGVTIYEGAPVKEIRSGM